MATYEELFGLRQDSVLHNKLTAAIVDAAVTILAETTGPNLVARQDWAKDAVQHPAPQSPEFIWAMLIANKAATPANIKTATDVAILANVNTAIDDRFGASS